MRRILIVLFTAALALAGVSLFAQAAAQQFFQAVEIHRGRLLLGTAITQVFEGATNDDSELTLTVTDPTADRTITFPNETGTLMTSTGVIRSSSPSAGVGYSTGAGCAVTQMTNRSTGVTCTGTSGAITTDSTSLAAEVSAVFTVTNTSVAVGDVVLVAIRSGMIALNTRATVTTVAAGSFAITVVNGNAAGGTAETGAMIINFAVVKGVSS